MKKIDLPCLATNICPYADAKTADDCDKYCLHGQEDGPWVEEEDEE